MIKFNAKCRKTIAPLFCLSLFFVITVSCAAPVINLSRIASQAKAVVSLIDTAEKALYITSNLVNASYEVLRTDISSQGFRTSSKFSNETIVKMEARHLELLAKHKELDNSIDNTNVAANNFF